MHDTYSSFTPITCILQMNLHLEHTLAETTTLLEREVDREMEIDLIQDELEAKDQELYDMKVIYNDYFLLSRHGLLMITLSPYRVIYLCSWKFIA